MRDPFVGKSPCWIDQRERARVMWALYVVRNDPKPFVRLSDGSVIMKWALCQT